jgi:hypothetical protein
MAEALETVHTQKGTASRVIVASRPKVSFWSDGSTNCNTAASVQGSESNESYKWKYIFWLWNLWFIEETKTGTRWGKCIKFFTLWNLDLSRGYVFMPIWYQRPGLFVTFYSINQVISGRLRNYVN